MNVIIHYYDINGDSKNVYLRISTATELIAAVNAIALGGNFISEIERHDAEVAR